MEHRENAKILHLMCHQMPFDATLDAKLFFENFKLWLWLLGNTSLFTYILFTIFVPINLPAPNQQNEGFPLEFLLEGPQTELRTLSQNCEQTLKKLRTNRIMNKRALLKKIFLRFKQRHLKIASSSAVWCLSRAPRCGSGLKAY